MAGNVCKKDEKCCTSMRDRKGVEWALQELESADRMCERPSGSVNDVQKIYGKMCEEVLHQV